MASTVQLLRRIKTAQNVSKTTRAMQMIAASKLKKAQDATLSSRPYVQKLSAVMRDIEPRIDKQSLPDYMKESKETGKTLVVVVSTDKGLCGGLNTNLLRQIVKRDKTNDIYVTVGKKMESAISHLHRDLLAAFPIGNTLPNFDIVYPIVKIINEQFLGKKVDSVDIISTHFVNAFIQKAEMTNLLPILPEDMAALEGADQTTHPEGDEKLNNAFQLFEPDAESILPELLSRYIEMTLFQEILESHLSEQAARMVSMQNATNSAKDIIEALRLEYNKSRQAKITSEILDITGASAAR